MFAKRTSLIETILRRRLRIVGRGVSCRPAVVIRRFFELCLGQGQGCTFGYGARAAQDAVLARRHVQCLRIGQKGVGSGEVGGVDGGLGRLELGGDFRFVVGQPPEAVAQGAQLLG